MLLPKGGETWARPTTRPGDYITPAVWGFPNASKRATKVELAHKWARCIHNPCRLGGPQGPGGQNHGCPKSGPGRYITLAIWGVPNVSEWGTNSEIHSEFTILTGILPTRQKFLIPHLQDRHTERQEVQRVQKNGFPSTSSLEAWASWGRRTAWGAYCQQKSEKKREKRCKKRCTVRRRKALRQRAWDIMPKKVRKKARKEVHSAPKKGFETTSMGDTAKKSVKKGAKKSAKRGAEERFCDNEHGGYCEKKREKKRNKNRKKRCTLHRKTRLPL